MSSALQKDEGKLSEANKMVSWEEQDDTRPADLRKVRVVMMSKRSWEEQWGVQVKWEEYEKQDGTFGMEKVDSWEGSRTVADPRSGTEKKGRRRTKGASLDLL